MHIQCNEELICQFDPTHQLRRSVAEESYSAVLGNWQACLMPALGSQFLLYVHAKSLYSTLDLMDSMSTPLIKQTVGNLRDKIIDMLNDYYCLTDYQENGIIQPFQNITFGPVQNRRMARITQGIILAYQKRFLQARRNSINREIYLWEIEDDLNNTSRRNLGGASPTEILRELIWSGIN